MKALSIQQPWVWLIINGYTNIENRTWQSTFRGEFFIHVAQRIDWHAFGQIGKLLPDIDMPCPAALPRGGIVGKATLVDVVQEHDSPWFTGPWAFVLEGVESLPFYLCRGKMGFWDIPDEYRKTLG